MQEEKLDENMVELLKRSVEQQGELLPVVKDQHGNLLAGRHRKAAKPDWRETTVMVTDELDRLLKIIHFNVQRRPSKEETATRLLEIAKILEDKGVELANISSQIAKLVPYSEQWIRELLPDKYKHVEFASEPKVVSPPITTQDMPLVECDCCRMGTRSPKPSGKYKRLCPDCFEKAQKWPRIFAEEPKPKTEVKEYKPKETGEFRRAQMHPGVSKMELAVLEELYKRGHKVEFQKHVCLEKTVVDFIVDGKPVYLDGKRVHRNREWTDTRIRERVAKIMGETVYAIPYERFTKTGVTEIVDELEGK